jgi:hypothetical protein
MAAVCEMGLPRSCETITEGGHSDPIMRIPSNVHVRISRRDARVCMVQVMTKHGRELKSGGYYKHGEIVTVSYVGNYGRSLGRCWV